MSAITTTLPAVEYPNSDGRPITDSTLQYIWIVMLRGNLNLLLRDRADVFVAGSHLIYPVEGDNAIRQAPGVYVAFGRPKGHRRSYRVWDEDGVFPQVVFEVLSPGNRAGEMNRKRAFYRKYGVEEYYVIDPDDTTADDVRGLRAEVEKIIPRGAGGEPVSPGPSPSLLARTLERFSGSWEGRRLPQTPRVKILIQRAYDEARHLNHNYVGTEHLLLGLLRERDGVVAQALMSTGLKLEAAREGVLNLLGSNMPTSVAPAHVVVMDALNTVLNAPAELTAEQLQLVRDRVRHLNEQKEVFVAALDFTLATRCRAEAETLTLLLAWYERRESL